MKKGNTSLAQFIITKRQARNLSQQELSELSSVTLDEIQSIEQGLVLFLATTVRQKLAKALKIENKEIVLPRSNKRAYFA